MTYAPSVQPGFVRRNRTAVLVGAGLLLVLVLFAILTTGGKAGTLDPEAYDPAGAHALEVLLQQQGVTVRRTTDIPTTRGLAGSATTTFVPLPQLLSDEELSALGDLPGDLVVAGAGDRTLQALDSRVQLDHVVDVRTRQPGCSVREAVNAGRAQVGGPVYTGVGRGCYGSTVLDVPDSGLLLIGDAGLMTNDKLAREGNAALAVGLLSRQRTLLWLMPDPARKALGEAPVSSPDDLLPSWVHPAELELALAVLMLALWRAQRLGRVVREPLPVVVRAAETVEGRGRLYRAARARQTAAEELRAGARRRLGPRVGAGRHPQRDALLAGLGLQTARPAEELAALLYGPQPADDASLVRLADELDALTREVTGP